MTERLIDAFEKREPYRHPLRGRILAHRVIAKLMIGTSLVLPLHLWNVHNINENIEVAENARINVDIRGEALDEENGDKAIVFINGFGTYDANNLVETFGEGFQEYIQDGQLWSVNYGNAPLSISEIAERIITLTEKMGVTRVDLVGYSAGGDVAVAVNDEIRATSSIDVPLIMGISTPDGTDNLRKEIQDATRNYLELLGKAPILAYYDPARFIGEAMLRQPLYMNDDETINIESFITTMDAILDDLGRKKFPSTKLLYDQYQAIENIDLEELINNITTKYEPNLLNPTLVYIGTGKGGYDYMVDDKTSGANFCKYAADAGLGCLLVNSPNAVHTKPEQSAEEYMQTFAEISPELQQMMAQEQNRYIRLTMPIPLNGVNIVR